MLTKPCSQAGLYALRLEKAGLGSGSVVAIPTRLTPSPIARHQRVPKIPIVQRCRCNCELDQCPCGLFVDGGCVPGCTTAADCCSDCAAAFRRQRISIQTSNAIAMAVNPPTRTCDASMTLDTPFRVIDLTGPLKRPVHGHTACFGLGNSEDH
jgi:hypothetical protein